MNKATHFQLNERTEFLNKLKNRGIFYTPLEVCELVKQLVLVNHAPKKIYDPTCGTGMLLAAFATKASDFSGQDSDKQSVELCQQNLTALGIKQVDVKHGDTLKDPQHNGVFDTIVANPPYSFKWNRHDSMINDNRFYSYGKLAPKSKADFAFICHILHHLADNGIAAVIVPSGVLFRGATEQHIRTKIIEKFNYLDAVIGLPVNLFFDTTIPVNILIFKKSRKPDDNVFILDASKSFEKDKKKNRLRDEDIKKIVNAYKKRADVERFASCVSLKKIKENDYNLNIPRYVDTFEPEPEIDIDEVANTIKAGEMYEVLVNKRLEMMTKDLHPKVQMPFLSDQERIKIHTGLMKIKTLADLEKFEKKFRVDSSEQCTSGTNTAHLMRDYKKGLMQRMFK